MERDSLSPLTQNTKVPEASNNNRNNAQADADNADDEANMPHCVILSKLQGQVEEGETVLDRIMLDDTEAISNSTFRCLIEDAAKANQSVIFARL